MHFEGIRAFDAVHLPLKPKDLQTEKAIQKLTSTWFSSHNSWFHHFGPAFFLPQTKLEVVSKNGPTLYATAKKLGSQRVFTLDLGAHKCCSIGAEFLLTFVGHLQPTNCHATLPIFVWSFFSLVFFWKKNEDLLKRQFPHEVQVSSPALAFFEGVQATGNGFQQFSFQTTQAPVLHGCLLNPWNVCWSSARTVSTPWKSGGFLMWHKKDAWEGSWDPDSSRGGENVPVQSLEAKFPPCSRPRSEDCLKGQVRSVRNVSAICLSNCPLSNLEMGNSSSFQFLRSNWSLDLREVPPKLLMRAVPCVPAVDGLLLFKHSRYVRFSWFPTV